MFEFELDFELDFELGSASRMVTKWRMSDLVMPQAHAHSPILHACRSLDNVRALEQN